MRLINASRLTTLVAFFAIAAFTVTVVSTASAQKKGKPKEAAVVAAPEPARPAVPKSPSTMREVLQGLQGQKTNLGTLSKLAGDYVVFDNEGDTVMYPLSVLQSVKLLKPEEEGGERKVEIRFLNRD